MSIVSKSLILCVVSAFVLEYLLISDQKNMETHVYNFGNDRKIVMNSSFSYYIWISTFMMNSMSFIMSIIN